MSDTTQRNNIGDRTGPWEPSEAFHGYMTSLIERSNELSRTYQFVYNTNGITPALQIVSPDGGYEAARRLFLEQYKAITGVELDTIGSELMAFCEYDIFKPVVHRYMNKLGENIITRTTCYKFYFSCMFQDDGLCEDDSWFRHIHPSNTSKEEAERLIFEHYSDEYGEVDIEQVWLADNGQYHSEREFQNNPEELGNLYDPPRAILDYELEYQNKLKD